METLDKASVYYNSGLILLSALQICMAHGLFVNPNQLKESELIVDGANLTSVSELAATAGNSLIQMLGTVVVFIVCVVLAVVVMLLLRLLLHHKFEAHTARRGLICAFISFAVCFSASIAFSRMREIGTSLLISLPIPVVSWLVYHLGRAPEDNQQNLPDQTQ